MWFEQLVGFREDDGRGVAERLHVDGTSMTSTVNGRTMTCGRFEVVSLQELRRRVSGVSAPTADRLELREVVADVRRLHLDPDHAGALFQVASQFNTLEMVSPEVRPEDGVDRYEADATQGPACAIACGAGTIYRNHLVNLDGQRGQSEHQQIDCLAPLATALDETIEMRNGYAFPTADQLARIASAIPERGPDTGGGAVRDELMGELRIGMQWDTEVTAMPFPPPGHLVSQAYCSALPVAYSSLSVPPEAWEPFARLVLDAAYEATLAAAVINATATGNNRVFLTLLGGGVFGNDPRWILDAIERAVDRHRHRDLDVAIVSHGRPNPRLAELDASRKSRRG